MMKNYLGLLLVFSLFLIAPGCGDSGEATNTAENAEMSEIEQYDAMIAEETAGMDADPPSDE